MHVHVQTGKGEAKFWLDPRIELDKNFGLANTQLGEIETIIEERNDEIRNAWRTRYKHRNHECVAIW